MTTLNEAEPVDIMEVAIASAQHLAAPKIAQFSLFKLVVYHIWRPIKFFDPLSPGHGTQLYKTFALVISSGYNY